MQRTESVPAFQPGTDLVAVVATKASTRAPRGVLLDARSGAIVHTLQHELRCRHPPDSGDVGNDGYALRFSPNGGLLAWNTGGSVVIWDVASAGGNQAVVQSDVVLTSSSFLDPTVLAISDNGEVATVGQNFYSDLAMDPTEVVFTGDELGRFLQPLGIARISRRPRISPARRPRKGRCRSRCPRPVRRLGRARLRQRPLLRRQLRHLSRRAPRPAVHRGGPAVEPERVGDLLPR